MGFVALATLLINGTTMGPLVQYLGLNRLSSEIAERNLQRIIDELDHTLRTKISKLDKVGGKKRKEKLRKEVMKVRPTALQKRVEAAMSDNNISKKNVSPKRGSRAPSNMVVDEDAIHAHSPTLPSARLRTLSASMEARRAAAAVSAAASVGHHNRATTHEHHEMHHEVRNC
jgi:hypothetical protein